MVRIEVHIAVGEVLSCDATDDSPVADRQRFSRPSTYLSPVTGDAIIDHFVSRPPLARAGKVIK